jgi:hypothetical protein
MTVSSTQVTPASVTRLINELKAHAKSTRDYSILPRLEEAIGVLEYFRQAVQTFESALRAEQGVQFDDGYTVNVAALIGGLASVQVADSPDGPFGKLASDALRLSGGGEIFDYADLFKEAREGHAHKAVVDSLPSQ